MGGELFFASTMTGRGGAVGRREKERAGAEGVGEWREGVEGGSGEREWREGVEGGVGEHGRTGGSESPRGT